LLILDFRFSNCVKAETAEYFSGETCDVFTVMFSSIFCSATECFLIELFVNSVLGLFFIFVFLGGKVAEFGRFFFFLSAIADLFCGF